MSVSVPRPVQEVTAPARRDGEDLDPQTLRVVVWRDPLVESFGFDPRSAYAEQLWLPLIGPTCTWLLRRLAAGLERSEQELTIDLGATARALGLAARSGRNSPMARALQRCVTFELARWRGEGTLAVRRMLPPLARRHLVRLPPELQDAHDRWTATQRHSGSLDRHRLRARRLSLGLVALGDAFDGAESQLVRWGVHPSLAHDAVAWARSQPGWPVTDADPGLRLVP